MRILLLCLLLLILFTSGYAVGEEIDWQDIGVDEIIEQAFDEEGNLKPEYRDLVEDFDLGEAPEELTDLLNGERSNIKIELEDGGEEIIGVAIEDNKIKEVKRGGIENPTSEITTTEETIEEIVTAEDPVSEFSESFGEGKIHYESKSEKTWLKGLIINTIAFLLWIINSITSFLTPLFK